MAPPLLAVKVASMAIAVLGQSDKSAESRSLAGAPKTEWKAPVLVASIPAPVCQGTEEIWGHCNTDACPSNCKPIDCALSVWSEWKDLGACTGVCRRTRDVKVANNHCGKACSGELYQTKVCQGDDFKTNCTASKPVNCEYSKWTEWSACKAGEQSYSERSIKQAPKAGGTACTGDIKKTRPCPIAASAKEDPDCKFGEWDSWSDCSRTCDGGHRSRSRRIVAPMSTGGKGCSGKVAETESCGKEACKTTKDCKLSDWKEWSKCDSATMQHYRTRDIEQPATANGAAAACEGHVKEAEGCDTKKKAKDCEFQEWAEWGSCSASCGGGQSYRSRLFKDAAVNGGLCKAEPMQETKGCNLHACPKSCKYSTWSEWTDCAPKCGLGTQTRHREASGYDCEGAVKVVRNCTTKCDSMKDCKWSNWEDWGACSLSCGGGTRARERKVTTLPDNGGKACEPLTTKELGPCNEKQCGAECINGTWADWSHWSKCSVTCQSGFQTRTRKVSKPPTHCGSPAQGLAVEVKECLTGVSCVKDVDCEVGQWSEWGDCNQDCFGVRERSREFTKRASGWRGASCANTSLKIVEACNPASGKAVPAKCAVGPAPVDCKLSQWEAWSTCSMACGQGQKTRVRNIEKFPVGTGKQCDGSLKSAESCQLKACPKPKCIDCRWSDWGQWGHCMVHSGDGSCHGQRFRHRDLAELANWCGTCSYGSSMEMEPCTGHCSPTVYCTWSSWSSTSKCNPNGCGPQTSSRHRMLQIVDKLPKPLPLANGTKFSTCRGDETKVEECPFKSCAGPKQDCTWHDWSEWSAPSCAQLCERSRTPASVSRNGGAPCQGVSRETKSCKKECEKPVDCQQSEWTQWSRCPSDLAQTYRTRDIHVEAVFGGKQCTGALRQTKWCSTLPDPVDCVVSNWAEWQACTMTCVGGSQKRKRAIKEHSAFGGKPCTESLEELRPCGSMKACTKSGDAIDCKLDEWTKWKEDPLTGQKSRERSIKTPASPGGAACLGAIHQVEPVAPIDCRISEWAKWDDCDRHCNEKEHGQQSRERIVNAYPQWGGKPCPPSLALLEVRGCKSKDKKHKCKTLSDDDAKAGPWGEWSPCTATCGPGQETRQRTVSTRGERGLGFDGSLKQTRPCPNAKVCAKTDCEWHPWSEWSACTRSCGGGEMTRSRDIAVAPKNQGAACAALPADEIRECGTQTCDTKKCIDGEWDEWTEWAACSATCGGGVQPRRRVLKTVANSCGAPVKGPEVEYRSCKSKVACSSSDCKFGDWDKWSGCTEACDGVTRRVRVIEKPGTGDGKFCDGSLTELKTCNPHLSTKGCVAAVKTDCEFDEWSSSKCMVTCGKGVVMKTRQVKVQAAFGGAPCTGATSAVEPCKDVKPCPHPKPVDCEMAKWSKWSACSGCHGQKKRVRDFAKMPAHGGANCTVTSTNETAACSDVSKCDQTFCVWSSWSSWTKCSRTCGTGIRHRKRQLKESAHGEDKPSKKAEKLFETYQELSAQMEAKSGARTQELAIAFIGGCMSLLALAGVFRLSRRMRRSQESSDTGIVGMGASQGYTSLPHIHVIEGVEGGVE